MRHAPTAPSRLRRAAVLAPLLLAAWCAAQPPATAQPPSAPDRAAAVAARPPESARPPRPRASAHELPATVHPAEAEDHSSALVPIAVGLALTAIASYKHRGLPRGH